jgi:uncharacterized membrane protein YraQ (UPF0718 family)
VPAATAEKDEKFYREKVTTAVNFPMLHNCGNPQPPEKKAPPPFDLLRADFSRPASQKLDSCCGKVNRSSDPILWVSLTIFLIGCGLTAFSEQLPAWGKIFSATCLQLAHQSWWAILSGILFMAILAHTPKELIAALLGKPGSISGILRATCAGVMLDLCNHGILMVGMGLYQRGASLGQTIAFLIASPWNSLSLTLLLTALIGIQWTILFLLLSALIGITTGYLVEMLTRRGLLPENPHAVNLPHDFSYRRSLRSMKPALRPTLPNLRSQLKRGLSDSRMVLRWVLLGFVLTAAVRSLMPQEWMHQHFGPTLWGLGLTLITTTLIEVCSEGSAPLAAELLRTARAPGNAFAFLMAGAATDSTEIMSLKSTTGRWICALILPLLAIPQVILVSYLMNSPLALLGSP